MSAASEAPDAAAGAPERSPRTIRAILVLGLAAALLMALAELTTLYSIDVITASCEDLADPDLADACVTTGGEQHSYALLLLAVLTGFLAWAAAVPRSRPAAFALLLVGAVVLLIALVGDLPDASATGEVGSDFDDAEAQPGLGLWLELAGGLLAATAGGLGFRAGRDYQR